MEYQLIYIGLAAAFGLFMAWGIGANDVANAMATSVGSKALTIKQAILVAAIFEFLGAVLAGGAVTSTIRKGIVDADSLSGTPELLVYGMLAALLAAGTWLLIASKNGWPVSTTHSIVGAIVGFAAVGIGVDAVKWAQGRHHRHELGGFTADGRLYCLPDLSQRAEADPQPGRSAGESQALRAGLHFFCSFHDHAGDDPEGPETRRPGYERHGQLLAGDRRLRSVSRWLGRSLSTGSSRIARPKRASISTRLSACSAC